MLVVIRNGKELSLKTNFLIKLYESSSFTQILLIYRKDADKYGEKWGDTRIDLGSSTSSILAYLLLTILKNPRDLRDGMLRRLFGRRTATVLSEEDFLSVISQVLYYYFASSARTNAIIRFLKRLDSPKVFLIDEFWSINTIDLKKLKHLGRIIYLSQDVACNRYGFRENLIAKELMYKLERDAIVMADLVIACSERDKLKYIEMGAKDAVFYPNIYPLNDFIPIAKDKSPSICIVSRGHWGSKADRSLEEIFKALSYVEMSINVYVIGVKPKQVPKNVRLHHYGFMQSKLDYLTLLSKSWIGINLGFHMAGSNERKYDYAMAGLVVFSDTMGARGDLLPIEYTYVDSQDLTAKLEQLLQLGKDKIIKMGEQNRDQALSLANKQREILLKTVNAFVLSKS